MSNEYSFQTRLLHNQHKVDERTGAVSVPIQHSSTFHQTEFDTFGAYDYSRSGNPTREALESAIADLEEGIRGFAFSSGMAAISTACMLLSQGDHVVVTKDVYGGTFRFITQVLNRFGIDHTFVDMTSVSSVKEGINERTKLIYMETPSNPTLNITDIRGVVKLAKEHGCLTFLDNTFLTPALQKPLTLGVDIVLHSATKFIGGHSDVLGGLAVVKDEELASKLAFLQNSFEAVLGVQDCWLVLRGLKTLHVRMEQGEKGAMQIARWLQTVEGVKQVYYPGLEEHPGHELQREQSEGFGAVLSFELTDEDAVRSFVKHVKLPVFAVSLGAVESILSYPPTMSHGAMPKEERIARGISDGLLRLSVGLEKPEELIADFAQAFHAIEKRSV